MHYVRQLDSVVQTPATHLEDDTWHSETNRSLLAFAIFPHAPWTTSRSIIDHMSPQAASGTVQLLMLAPHHARHTRTKMQAHPLNSMTMRVTSSGGAWMTVSSM